MRTITLELLRHGPPHNQLLSPLTQYLALCENHPPVTLTLPFEHNQFLYRLQALGYQLGDAPRAFQIHDTARELGALLGRIPGLIAELSRESCEERDGRSGGQRSTHLRLVLSASELALLPWELATAPDGCPGAGQHLLLQSQDAVSLTREVRRVSEQVVQWSRKPRILFVAAAPPGVGAIPLEAHLLALRKLIDPWVGAYASDEERHRKIAEHLVVVPEATAERIEEECAKGGFTHVHILAHGVSYQAGFDVRFGLALHDARNPDGPYDIVTGERLATILRAPRSPASEGLARPISVTLASCNSGNVGTVAGVGASIAHALHDAGISMVVAGQFPVSFEGSVVMVEVLYGGLLWGEDPRLTVRELTRRLHAAVPATHDWASVTAYASLPPDLDARLVDAQIEQAKRAIEVAMAHADKATEGLYEESSPLAAKRRGKEHREDALRRAREKIAQGVERLERLAKGKAVSEELKSRIYGQIASTEKRRAEVEYWSAEGKAEETHANAMEECRRALRKARRCYWDAFVAARGNAWGAVQYLSMDTILSNLRPEVGDPDRRPHGEHNAPDALWTVAHTLSLAEFGSDDATRAAWAYGNLVELYLLGLVVPIIRERWGEEELVERATSRAGDLVSRVGPDTFKTYSTRRQIVRYVDWYRRIAALGDLPDRAKQVLTVLPESDRTDWDKE